MKLSTLLSVFLMSLLLTSTIICQDKPTREKHKRQSEGEEPGTRLKTNEVYDHTRKDIRLVLSYNKVTSSFEGSVENVSEKTIKSVRVEVHLSNNVELGPTKPFNLSPKEKRAVILSAGKSGNIRTPFRKFFGHHSGVISDTIPKVLRTLNRCI